MGYSVTKIYGRKSQDHNLMAELATSTSSVRLIFQKSLKGSGILSLPPTIPKSHLSNPNEIHRVAENCGCRLLQALIRHTVLGIALNHSKQPSLSFTWHKPLATTPSLDSGNVHRQHRLRTSLLSCIFPVSMWDRAAILAWAAVERFAHEAKNLSIDHFRHSGLCCWS
jgi:hypothetical protein